MISMPKVQGHKLNVEADVEKTNKIISMTVLPDDKLS